MQPLTRATRFHPHKSLAPSDWPEPTFRATGETDTTSLRRAASILQVFKAKFNHRWSIHFSVLHANVIIKKRGLPGNCYSLLTVHALRLSTRSILTYKPSPSFPVNSAYDHQAQTGYRQINPTLQRLLSTRTWFLRLLTISFTSELFDENLISSPTQSWCQWRMHQANQNHPKTVLIHSQCPPYRSWGCQIPGSEILLHQAGLISVKNAKIFFLAVF